MWVNQARFHPAIAFDRLLICALLALEVFIVLGQADPLTSAMGRDSGMYTYVASQLLHGQTPYVDAWEHKPPAIFFIDALGLVVGGGSRWGIYAVEAAFLLGTAAAGFAALKTAFGPGPAMWASAGWLGALAWLLRGGNLTEEYALLFSFAALWIFTRILKHDSPWDHLALGVAFGCGFLTRPNNAGVQLAIVLSLVLSAVFRRGPLAPVFRGLIATAAGFLIPLAAASAFFLSRHAFLDMIQAGFIYNLYYGSRADFIGSLLGGVGFLGYLAYIALAGIALAGYSLWTQIKARAVDALTLWLCLDVLIEIYFSGLSGRAYIHYFIDWLPWMAVSYGLLASRIFPGVAKWAARFPARMALITIEAVAIAGVPTLVGYARGFSQPASDQELENQRAVVQYVDAHTQPGQTVLAWCGEAAINVLSGREAPTAQFQYGILSPSSITDRLSAQFYQDLRVHPPALIIDPLRKGVAPLSVNDPVAWSLEHGAYPQPYMQEVFDFVHRNYTYTATVGGMLIYKLNR